MIWVKYVKFGEDIMIPKIIHYCWFGGKNIPQESVSCIESWKKHCPDYRIIEWNDYNYNLQKNDYVKITYSLKKYAFLTDYVRLDVIGQYGGIYLDTDVELLKPLDPLLHNDGFLGLEEEGRIATGLGFGAIKNHPFILENKKYYEDLFLSNNRKKFEKIICVKVTTDLMCKHGYVINNQIQTVYGMTIYPTDYFCPLKIGTSKLKITQDTYSIHHYNGSWKSNNKYWNRLQYYMIPLKQWIKKYILKKRNYE